MNQVAQNGSLGTEVVEALPQPVSAGAAQAIHCDPPYVPARGSTKLSLQENRRVLAIGGGIVLVLLLLALNGIANKPRVTRPGLSATRDHQPIESQSSAPASVTPIINSGRVQNTDDSLVTPDQIARTSVKHTQPHAAANLGSVPPFENSQPWQPPPYRAGLPAAAQVDQNAATQDSNNTKSWRDAMDKASLVFVRNNPSSARVKVQDTNPPIAWGVGLAPGTRLRARLASAVSTAVPMPVVAIIEYNYEQDGEIAIPAGAKAYGHLEAADRSGYIGIRFDSLTMADGSTLHLEATAIDLQLKPLRGKVEGKHQGQNLLVRSLAGVGEIAATLVGRGSLNQPISESDLLRERVSNNIGQASDQTVAKLATAEHIVVSIPADTEIDVVLQKPAKQTPDAPRAEQAAETASRVSLEQLRELMQLQDELNQRDATKSPPE